MDLNAMLKKQQTIGTTKTTTKRVKKHRSPTKVLTATERYLKSRIEELTESLETTTEQKYVQDAIQTIQTSITAIATLKSTSTTSSTTTATTTATSSLDWKFNHKTAKSLSADLLQQIDWKECVGVQRSDTGTDGVLFVSFQDSTAVCIKAPGTIAAEVYGSWLAKRVGGKYSKRRRSNVAVIIVGKVCISSFLFDCLLLNHSFSNKPKQDG